MAKLTREGWLRQQEGCMACGSMIGGEVHEIARGPARQKALEEPAAWLAVCRECHEQLGDYSVWPVVRQLALKRLRDPNRYNRRKINELRHRAAEAISEAEVLRAQHDLCNPFANYRILAFDNGRKTGWAELDDGMGASGVCNLEKLPPGAARYARYRQLLLDLVPSCCLIIAVEKPGQYKSWEAAVPQYACYAILQEFAFSRDIPLIGYGIGRIKATVTGDGSADKKRVAKAVSERFDLDPAVKAGDEADALAVLATALQDPEVWALVPKGT